MKFSNKYWDFINYVDSEVEILEGTTASGKTVGAVFKFMLNIAESKKKLHVIASRTTGIAEKNIINSDAGIKYQFGILADYNGNGDKDNKLPHIKYVTPNGTKVIYVLGYNNKDKSENALGSQFGCVFIDEINTADIEFVREISSRCDYLLATLNPDNPSLPIYDEYINHCRPIEKYKKDVPESVMTFLKNQKAKDKWLYWFFSFKDNISLTQEDIERKISRIPPGTKIYKNKILGLRGKATGLVFVNFDRLKHVVSANVLNEQMTENKLEFIQFSVGVDTAYSQKSADTIAMVFEGITSKGTIVVLDEKVYNNADLYEPLAPSDTIDNIIEFCKRNCKRWGFARNIYIDSADQATLTEAKKYKRLHSCIYNFVGSYKKMPIIDRINLQLDWIHTGHYMVCDHCKTHIEELENYSWQEDKDNKPEDANDHTINAVQYGFLPYVAKIGDR